MSLYILQAYHIVSPEGIYEYEEAATPEDVEWPDLSGKDVIFI